MANAGLSEDLILTRLRKEKNGLALTVEDMLRLKAAKISDLVIKTLIDPSAVVPAQEAPGSAPHPSTTSPAGAVKPGNAVAVPLIAVPSAAQPSGATPGAGTPGGDPNDPMAPHDSGIYYYSIDRAGKPTMVVLERAAYQGSKTGGVFTSAMTAGLKKMKMKAVIPGTRAPLRVEQQPVFYFYFDDKAAGLGKSMFGTASISNPSQFALVRLEQKKNNRETIIGEMGVLGASTGTHEKSMMAFKSERLKPGLYKVTLASPLQAGEYSFLASTNIGGAMMAGAQGAVDIFDFGVDQ